MFYNFVSVYCTYLQQNNVIALDWRLGWNMLVFVNIETASSQIKKKIHAYKFMVQVKEKSFKENQNFYTK